LLSSDGSHAALETTHPDVNLVDSITARVEAQTKNAVFAHGFADSELRISAAPIAQKRL
jgi:hypothetical protein